MAPCVFDGTILGLAHPVLDLGERLLDWIEIAEYGGGRQVAEALV